MLQNNATDNNVDFLAEPVEDTKTFAKVKTEKETE